MSITKYILCLIETNLSDSYLYHKESKAHARIG